jgi:hypothetical protein
MPSAFSTGFCHAAVGAAFHLRATPVLKAFPFDARAREVRGIAPATSIKFISLRKDINGRFNGTG